MAEARRPASGPGPVEPAPQGDAPPPLRELPVLRRRPRRVVARAAPARRATLALPPRAGHYRGALIFALALYGFWTAVFEHLVPPGHDLALPDQLAVRAVASAIPGFTRHDRSRALGAGAASTWTRWTRSRLLDRVLGRSPASRPAAWLLTAGGALVLVVLLKGVIGGASRPRRGRAGAREAPSRLSP